MLSKECAGCFNSALLLEENMTNQEDLIKILNLYQQAIELGHPYADENFKDLIDGSRISVINHSTCNAFLAIRHAATVINNGYARKILNELRD